MSFEDSVNYGERFYFYRNYITRTSEFIASHFGADMMHILFEDTTSFDSWQGPYVTEYGAHLVLIRERKAQRLPSLVEVAPQVLADYQRQRREQVKVQAVEKLKSKYRILR